MEEIIGIHRWPPDSVSPNFYSCNMIRPLSPALTSPHLNQPICYVPRINVSHFPAPSKHFFFLKKGKCAEWPESLLIGLLIRKWMNVQWMATSGVTRRRDEAWMKRRLVRRVPHVVSHSRWPWRIRCQHLSRLFGSGSPISDTYLSGRPIESTNRETFKNFNGSGSSQV